MIRKGGSVGGGDSDGSCVGGDSGGGGGGGDGDENHLDINPVERLTCKRERRTATM